MLVFHHSKFASGGNSNFDNTRNFEIAFIHFLTRLNNFIDSGFLF